MLTDCELIRLIIFPAWSSKDLYECYCTKTGYYKYSWIRLGKICKSKLLKNRMTKKQCKLKPVLISELKNNFFKAMHAISKVFNFL